MLLRVVKLAHSNLESIVYISTVGEFMLPYDLLVTDLVPSGWKFLLLESTDIGHSGPRRVDCAQPFQDVILFESYPLCLEKPGSN